MRLEKRPPHPFHKKHLPPKALQVTGRLKGHREGYGFVISDKPGEPDVYIRKMNMGGAMHGDRVSACMELTKRGGPQEGRIVKVLERAHAQIVGQFREGRVVPSNKRIVQELSIPVGKSLSAKEGDIVSARILRYPAAHKAASRPRGRKRMGSDNGMEREEWGEGEILKILGRMEDPNIDTLLVAESYALPPDFTPLSHQEADEIPQQVTAKAREGRIDLRSLPTVTIDGEKARDFDDAISIEKETDRFRLWVHITDVSHFIREGSSLDREAYLRATSVYFPDAVYPMFPPKLSNGILSLNPKKDRLTLTAEMEFDAEGNQIDYKLYESVIESNERMTYTAVREILEDKTEALMERYASLIASFKTMKELALLLRKKRLMRGSLDFDLPEPEIILSLTGEIMDVLKGERNIAHQMIEEFMLAANETVARHMQRRSLPFLYRVHDPPDPKKIAEFNELIAVFGLALPKTKMVPKHLSDVLEQVRGRSEEKLFNETLLRSMKQACYSEKNKGHFGLASETYTHFTSPVRRYPDLMVHRLLKEALLLDVSLARLLPHSRVSDRSPRSDCWGKWAEQLPEIARHTSERGRVADEVEREVVKRKKVRFMEGKVGKTYRGWISGVTSFGFFVELKAFFVEGLVHIKTLGDDYYLYDERHHRFVGRETKRIFQLGDPIEIRVERASLEHLELHFSPTEKFPQKARKRDYSHF